MAEHYYDEIGICLKCDLCGNANCCEQSDECDGQNWAFHSNGSIQQFAKEIMERRKNVLEPPRSP